MKGWPPWWFDWLDRQAPPRSAMLVAGGCSAGECGIPAVPGHLCPTHLRGTIAVAVRLEVKAILDPLR